MHCLLQRWARQVAALCHSVCAHVRPPVPRRSGSQGVWQAAVESVHSQDCVNPDTFFKYCRLAHTAWCSRVTRATTSTHWSSTWFRRAEAAPCTHGPRKCCAGESLGAAKKLQGRLTGLLLPRAHLASRLRTLQKTDHAAISLADIGEDGALLYHPAGGRQE
jgi:hypothetical protein